MKEFKTARMDKRTRAITIALLIILPLIAISSFLLQPPKLLVSISLTVVLFAAIFISYSLVPKRIAISADQILIKNLFGASIINIKEIETILKVKATGFNLRTFGVGGLFGFFGFFNGDDVWYVTNIHHKVKIKLKSGKIYMISPDHSVDFIREIEQRSLLTP